MKIQDKYRKNRKFKSVYFRLSFSWFSSRLEPPRCRSAIWDGVGLGFVWSKHSWRWMCWENKPASSARQLPNSSRWDLHSRLPDLHGSYYCCFFLLWVVRWPPVRFSFFRSYSCVFYLMYFCKNYDTVFIELMFGEMLSITFFQITRPAFTSDPSSLWFIHVFFLSWYKSSLICEASSMCYAF